MQRLLQKMMENCDDGDTAKRLSAMQAKFDEPSPVPVAAAASVAISAGEVCYEAPSSESAQTLARAPADDTGSAGSDAAHAGYIRCTGKNACEVNLSASGERPDWRPCAIARNALTDEVWVIDAKNAKMVVFDASMQRTRDWDLPEELVNRWNERFLSLALDPRAELVYFYAQRKIHVYRPDGTFLYAFGNGSSRPDEFDTPNAAVSPITGHLFIARERRIDVYSCTENAADVKMVHTWSKWQDVPSSETEPFVPCKVYNCRRKGCSKGPSVFEETQGITVASDGHVYVTDGTRHFRVLVFTEDGTYLRTLGQECMGPMGDTIPGVVVSDLGEVFMCANMQNRIYVFDKMTGKLLRRIRSPVNCPYYIALTGKGEVLVTFAGYDGECDNEQSLFLLE